MKRTWTITVEIADNPYSTRDENEEDMEYWNDVVETHILGIESAYRSVQERHENDVNTGVEDFTYLVIERERE